MGCARLSIQEDARKSGCCNCSFQGDSSLHFFPAVAFFVRLQWPRVYNRLKLGKWGLGHGQLCCSIFCINRLIFTQQGLANKISKTGNDFCHFGRVKRDVFTIKRNMIIIKSTPQSFI